MNVRQQSNIINNSFTHSNTISSNESSFKAGKESGTKLNFQEVMEVAQDKQSGKVDKASSNPEYPLESYALPSWFKEYLPEETILSSEINHDFWGLAEDFSKDNILTDQEENQLKDYLLKDPLHQAELEKSKFRTEFKEELNQYCNFLFTSFHDILKENGIDSRKDYYQNVILDKENSEILHMEMDNRLKSNPQIRELMDILL